MQMKKTTLCAIIDKQNSKVLMIKRLHGMKGFSSAADGMAKDLYNLPGGKNQPDESFIDCALRETVEETGITPKGLVLCGQLQFVWPDLTVINQVFRTNEWSGGIRCAAGECDAEWVDLDQIPYDNMWADDRTWFPEMLAGKFFHYRVVVMNETDVEITPLPIDEIHAE